MARSLDKALGLAFPALHAACSTCGAPNFALGLVIVLRPEDEILTCPDCGGSVTSSGLSLTPARPTRYLKVVVLEEDP